MAKNKLRGKKSRNVFHIASQNFKSQNKAKPVTTNLKKINTQHHKNKPVNVNEAATLMAQL
ncbi:ribosomal biogenesis factor-like isoform X2 [Fukomys damarensis]|uniref:ribosomal biogenesis factor-like isoform X2 n=1 Tax=Fukomys damarensis TaxID=885580 RepID=UPI0014554D5E|nr:ribosomal biogenesis factor-like isoform X2 [Fukomys damarensis]